MLSAEVTASLVPIRRFWTIDIMTFLEGCVAQTASAIRPRDNSSAYTGFGEIHVCFRNARRTLFLQAIALAAFH
jgi:hypothetical protein